MRKERLEYWLIEHMITATDLGGLYGVIAPFLANSGIQKSEQKSQHNDIKCTKTY